MVDIPIPLIILVYPQILFRMVDTGCVSYGGTFSWSMLISRAEMFVCFCVCVFLPSFFSPSLSHGCLHLD